MSRTRLITLSLAGLAAVWLALGAVGVLSAPDTDIPWSVFGSGGGTSSSTNYDLGATAGQSATGPSQSTNYKLGAGYWYGAVDSDGDGLLDVLDPCRGIVDCDSDGWTDWQEFAFITTDPENACTPLGWPPDPSPQPNGNGTVQIDDVFFAASRFNQADGDANHTRRAEIASQDGIIGIDDIFGFAGRFNQSC